MGRYKINTISAQHGPLRYPAVQRKRGRPRLGMLTKWDQVWFAPSQYQVTETCAVPLSPTFPSLSSPLFPDSPTPHKSAAAAAQTRHSLAILHIWFFFIFRKLLIDLGDTHRGTKSLVGRTLKKKKNSCSIYRIDTNGDEEKMKKGLSLFKGHMAHKVDNFFFSHYVVPYK